jgi:hypothetical protein
MSEILNANIFFIITSIAVILFTLLVCVVLYHVIKILQSIRKIVDRVEEGSENIVEDVSRLRTYVLEGSLLSQIISFFVGTKKTRARKSQSKDNSTD